MFVVTVLFKIRAERYDEFMHAMLENAQTSLATELACRQFDVCEGATQECLVFLYELYDTPDAFQAHLKTPHFLQFNAQTAPWVIDKTVATFQRASLDNDQTQG